MNKRLLTLMLLFSAAGAAFSSFAFTYNGLEYEILDEEGKTCKVGWNGFNCHGDIAIPETAYDGSVGYTVTEIGVRAFTWCTGLTSVTIPNSVTEIGGEAFSYCSGLTSVTIPNSVTEIGGEAFSYCSGLTSVTIPNSVTEIGNGVFSKCSGLTSIEVDEANLNYKSESGALYSKDGTKLIIYPAGKPDATFDIPNSVTTIGNSAFNGCTGLTSVTIPNSVTTIGNSAFNGCTGLTSLTIPNSVTEIGISAFSGCYGLTSVTIPNSVTKIEDYAFSGCTGLTSVTIPNSVTTIGNGAFNGCTGLTSVTISNSVTEIEDHAFLSCPNLTSIEVDEANLNYKSESGVLYSKDGTKLIIYPAGKPDATFDIPNSVTEIERFAFSNCRGLTTVTIPQSVTKIGNSAFAWCTGLTSVTIPNSVTEIEDGAFYECTGLTSVTIPNSVTGIGGYVFYGCTGLTSVTIPNSVTEIGKQPFARCTALASVNIGYGVSNIGPGAFNTDGYDTDGVLKNIYITAANPPAMEGSAVSEFDGVTLHVLPGSVDSYKSAEEWSNFTSVEPLVEAETLTLSHSEVEAAPGQQIQLQATLAPATATLTEVFYLSSDPEVATVDHRGLVTVKGAGSCEIRAESLYEGVEAVCRINAGDSGIENVIASESAADGSGNVYSLQGILLKRNATQADVDALAPGLYIVGGKKVLVK